MLGRSLNAARPVDERARPWIVGEAVAWRRRLWRLVGPVGATWGASRGILPRGGVSSRRSLLEFDIRGHQTCTASGVENLVRKLALRPQISATMPPVPIFGNRLIFEGPESIGLGTRRPRFGHRAPKQSPHRHRRPRRGGGCGRRPGQMPASPLQSVPKPAPVRGLAAGKLACTGSISRPPYGSSAAEVARRCYPQRWRTCEDVVGEGVAFFACLG